MTADKTNPTKIDLIQPYQGRIWVVGDAIDTDLIVPSRVLTETDPKKQIAATLEVVIPNFAERVQPGDIILAGKNFGCGSSREEAVFVLKELGIVAVIAESFARIFYRNCINLGLPPITLKSVSEETSPGQISLGKEGETLLINFKAGTVENLASKNKRSFQSFPPFLDKYLTEGGIIAYLKKK